MIENTEQVVRLTLEENPRARKDDFILYGGVLKRMGINIKQSLAMFLATAKDLKMPSFETVTRCRRKLQEQDSTLIDAETKELREKQENEFIAYSKA